MTAHDLRRPLPRRRHLSAQDQPPAEQGENLHAPRPDLFHAGEGAVRRRRRDQQTEQAGCLTLVTNAIITWVTEYYGLAVAQLRAAGRWIDDESLAHIWPGHHENVNFFGTITLDTNATGRRGPRPARPLDRPAPGTATAWPGLVPLPAPAGRLDVPEMPVATGHGIACTP